MAPTKSTEMDPKRSVWIGNISFEAPEEEVKAFLERAGSIDNIKFVADSVTKRFRGYLFCEYTDPQGAESACLMLNGASFYGRTIKVDMLEQRRQVTVPGGSRVQAGGQANSPIDQAAKDPLSPGVLDLEEGNEEVHEDETPEEEEEIPGGAGGDSSSQRAASKEMDFAVSTQVVASMTDSARRIFLKTFKHWCVRRPAEARQLLTRFPSLSIVLQLSLIKESTARDGSKMPLSLDEMKQLSSKK